jgi:hypothetical protein
MKKGYTELVLIIARSAMNRLDESLKHRVLYFQ